MSFTPNTLRLSSPNFLRYPNPNLPLPVSKPCLLHCLKSSLSDHPASLALAPTQESLTRAQTRVDILSESLPFIQKFRGKTIVVKYGGAAMKSQPLQASVINDLVLLSVVGLRPVFVHGGGPEINHWLSRLGIESIFRDGLRVTDSSTIEIVTMVLVGKVNKHLVALINKAGATAVGLSGLDGRLFTARPKPNSAQLGFVGDVARVDPTILRELAAALGAEKLILLTDVPGILENRDDPGSLVKEIGIKGVKKMMEEGKIAGGMIPKVNCCVRSLAQGVRTASIIDGRLPHSLLLEILTDEGAGTMITG
ncbi:hypothetical protein L1049_016415 [Liquidambar formosana]|uniref:Aspartate/glutamate/uridylate kinase domain-containing protein n=1 Tax=Liquidambar formosana TaxID=63359 RepID=A0AAP0RZB5_LIQFO